MGWLESMLAPENVLALLGVVVTVGVLSYERLIPGRKRIGFRVQMDTVIDDGDQRGDEDDGPPHQRLSLLEGDPDLAGASLVLLRIENDGFRSIDAGDYITAPEYGHGLTVTFPCRTVRDVAVTEPSHPTLLRYLPRGGTPERPGLLWSGPEISLPRVPLNRGDHFKLLVLLTGPGGGRQPQVVGSGRAGSATTRGSAGRTTACSASSPPSACSWWPSPSRSRSSGTSRCPGAACAATSPSSARRPSGR